MDREHNEHSHACLGKRRRKLEYSTAKSLNADLPASPDAEKNEHNSFIKNTRVDCTKLRFSCPLLDFYLYGHTTQVIQPIKESESNSKNTVIKFPLGMSHCESSIPGCRYGVCCSRFISVGTWIGPYEGEVIRPEELTADRDNRHMWEVYKDDKLSHYVDGSDMKFSNWMSSIQCARHKDEQNMTVFQYNGNLYYRAFRDILPFTEILVWYDDRYTDSMDMESISMGGSPREPGLFLKRDRHAAQLDGVDQMSDAEPNEYFGMGSFNETTHQWRCGQCEKSFSQRAALQMHVCSKNPEQPFQCGQCSATFSRPDDLRGHVVQHVSDKPFKCGFCARTFSGSTTLANHIRTHTGEKPFKCRQCGKSFSQSTQLSRHEKSGENCAKKRT